MDNEYDNFRVNETVNFARALYSLKLLYEKMIELLETFFSGYMAIIDRELNRNYLRLCFRINEILKDSYFEKLNRYEWQPFENLLVLDIDAPGAIWEYGGSHLCYNFLNEIEKLLISMEVKPYSLFTEDKRLLDSINTYLEIYSRNKVHHEKKFFNNLEKRVKGFEIEMNNLIELSDIDEFSAIKNVPNSGINKEVIETITNIYEHDLERFIREILFDPVETSHDPMEIADILTDHVHIKGEKRLTAFILKGKSMKKITSKGITHQFAKLQTISGIRLIVLAFVGTIQDDARRDFIRTADNIGCDYLIINAQDLSRLLIAYEKICSIDGTIYSEDLGVCKNKHSREEGIILQINAKEEPLFSIIKQKDVSNAGSKRYTATVLVDRHYTKETFQSIIQQSITILKTSNYQRNEYLKAKWGNNPAHIIWLFLASDLEDVQNVNWICRALWIDPNLPKTFHPLGLPNDCEIYKGIKISWNKNYKTYKKLYKSFYGTKEEIIRNYQMITSEMVKLTNKGVSYNENYKQGIISETEFILKMQAIEPTVSELYRKASHIPLEPEDCRAYAGACQSLFAIIHDIFLFYSKKGVDIWSKKDREYLVQDKIAQFKEYLPLINIEEKKLN